MAARRRRRSALSAAVRRTVKTEARIARKLEQTSTPGVYRRHAKACRGGRCSCAYVVVWRYRGKQFTETYRTLAEAREAKGNRDAGERRPVARVGFGEYFEEWIESYAGRTARGFSETTRPEYRRPIERHAMPRWASWRLAEIEPADVRDLFGDMRRQGETTSAIKKLRAPLSAMFATALEDGYLRANPVLGVRVPAALEEPDVEDDRARALTRAELSIFLSAVPDDWVLFFEFLGHSGLRISEAVGLRWVHLDLGEKPRILVREQLYKGKRRKLKSGSGRRDVPLSRGMTERLIAVRRDQYRGEEHPVFGSRTGTPLRPENVHRRVLSPARDSVGMSWVTFHSFRHTCASLLFAEGRNVKQVQEWLGHADPGFTLRTYVHLMDEGVGDADFLDLAVAAATLPEQVES